MRSKATLYLPISPTPTSTSYNLNSASYGHKDIKGARRYGNITRNLNKLKSTNHLIALQELKFDPFENKAFSLEFRDWGRCYSNAPASGKSNRAGTMLLIAPVLCKAYEINQFDLGAPTHGHIQAVLFTPKDPNSELEGFLFINIYLATGARNGSSDAARKYEQLAPLLRLPSGLRTIMCGDFNFVESNDDTTSLNAKNHFLGGTVRDVWEKVLDRFDLHEISQPTHTFIRTTTGPEGFYSSRLDRFYISFSESDYTLHTPTAFLPNVPHTAFNHIQRTMHNSCHAENLFSTCSDHHPLTLSFAPTGTKNKTTAFSIPRWMPYSQIFCDFVRNKILDHEFSNDDPFSKNLFFKQTLREAKKFLLSNPSPSHANRVDKLPGAISILRFFNSRVRILSDLRLLIAKYPNLSDLLVKKNDSANSYNATATRSNIRNYINDIFDTNNISVKRNADDPLANFTPDQRGCINSEIPKQGDNSVPPPIGPFSPLPPTLTTTRKIAALIQPIITTIPSTIFKSKIIVNQREKLSRINKFKLTKSLNHPTQPQSMTIATPTRQILPTKSIP